MLGMFDVGALVGAPTVGGILNFARLLGLPAYPTMFLCVAFAMTLIAGIYWFGTATSEPMSMACRSAPRRRKRMAVASPARATVTTEAETIQPDYCEAMDR